MDKSVERYFLSNDGMRWLRLSTGLAFAAMCGLGVARLVIEVWLGRDTLSDALPFMACFALFMFFGVGIILPAIFAHEICGSHAGVELRLHGSKVLVPWRNVSACRTLVTDPLFGYRALGFDLYVDGHLERVIFLPSARAEEWIEYFRESDPYDAEDDDEESDRPRGVAITC